MIIFNIPSWYPSASNPIYGTFIQEQLMMMAENRADSHFVISKWGQGQEEMLLWSSNPVQSFTKLISKPSKRDIKITENVHEFFTPAFTWSRKFLKGNIKGIIQANEDNLKRTIAQYGKPDIIHCQAAYPAALIGHYLSKKYQVPFVVTIRMSPFPFREFLNGDGTIKAMIRRPLAAAESLIATSTSLGIRLKNLDFTNANVCNNPVDTAFFKPNHSNKRGKRLIAVGRLVDQKGFDVLLQAMKDLDSSITLTLIGDGVEKIKLTAMRQSLGLNDRVSFLGELDRLSVRDKLQQHDALVLSSRHETFGNVLVEALACGIPVVSTDCGGPSDIVTDDVGVLCEKENAEALNVAIVKVLSKNWDSHKIREYAVQKFSPAGFTEKMFRIYQQSIDNFHSKGNNDELNLFDSV